MPASRAHRSVGRIDQVLELVARSPGPPTMTEIASALGLPRSTTADLLRELRDHGYLRATGRRYRLGFRPYVLGRLAGLGSPTGIDHDRLVELSAVASAPLALAVLVGAQVLYLDSAGPRAPEHLQRIADAHIPRPALRTAAGRLLLASADAGHRALVLGRLLDDPDAVTAFERERVAITRAGLARSDGYADPTIRALAVPVVEDGAVTAALVLFGPRRGPRRTTVTAGDHDPALEAAAIRVLRALDPAHPDGRASRSARNCDGRQS